MLNLKNKAIELNAKQKEIIQGFGMLTPDHWKRNETRLRIAIRDCLKEQQNNICVYCGCPIFGSGDVEHIAHKAFYPQFLFTPKNLALACKTCNQTYKGQADIVTAVDSEYDKCTFKMVHPYLDDVNHFFDTGKLEITLRDGLNEEERGRAEYTVTLLHWKKTEVVEHRAEAKAAEKYYLQNSMTPEEFIEKDRLRTAALEYKPING